MIEQPPTDDATKPLQLDGVTFTRDEYLHETATRDGELRPDGEASKGRCQCERCARIAAARPIEAWQVRKRDRGGLGVFGEWKFARSAAEARAFIVSSRA